MKKLLLLCAFIMGISAISYAQGGRPPQTPDALLERLKTRGEIAGITDDQAAKIKAIYAVQIKSTDSLRTALNGDFKSYFSKAAPITAASNAKISAVLTADQNAAFKKYNDAQAERMKQYMQQQGN